MLCVARAAFTAAHRFVIDLTAQHLAGLGTEAALVVACPQGTVLSTPTTTPPNRKTPMRQTATRSMHTPQRLRAAATRTPRGSSSLLRLSSGTARLPRGADLSQWIDRAALALAAG
jgi:hypothetical protein